MIHYCTRARCEDSNNNNKKGVYKVGKPPCGVGEFKKEKASQRRVSPCQDYRVYCAVVGYEKCVYLGRGE
jgi:hypothetical protein